MLSPRRIIILKGRPSSGKSKCLRECLPPLLNQPAGKRSIYYKGLWILIIRRSIQESFDWKKVIEKILNDGYDVIIIPAWPDDFLRSSNAFIKERLEDLISRRTKEKFIFHIVETNIFDKNTDRIKDQRKCAQNIMDYVMRLRPLSV